MEQPLITWLSVAEVAAILGVSPMTVRRMIKRGELPASPASSAKRAKWMIDAAEFERQRAADVERAAFRQRLAGVVTGRGEEFFEKLAEQHPDATVDSPNGPTLADYMGALEPLRDMRADPAVQRRLEELDEAERFESEARELARRIRRDADLLKRAREILREEDD